MAATTSCGTTLISLASLDGRLSSSSQLCMLLVVPPETSQPILSATLAEALQPEIHLVSRSIGGHVSVSILTNQ